MAVITISLSEPMKDWVDEQVSHGDHQDASEYLQDLITREQQRLQSKASLQAIIDDGMKSGSSPRTMPDILEDARRRVKSGSR